MDYEDDDWELSPVNCHPRTASLLTDAFYWDPADDNSPFGNDTGADTLSHYREWLAENRSNPLAFLEHILESFDAGNENWDVIEPAEIDQLLEQDEFSLTTRDDVIIALAFSQLVLEGTIDVEVKRRAAVALQRESTESMLAHRDWTDQAERLERLGRMRKVLDAV